MATSRMRHFNSPEELAKRQGAPEAERTKPKGFMHYNHPDAIAARAAAAAGGTPAPEAVVVPASTAIVPAATGPRPARARQPRQAAIDATDRERLEQLEQYVYAFLDDVSEAREFRMQLNNQAAQTETQLQLVARMKALETALDIAADKVAEGEVFSGLEQRLHALEQQVELLLDEESGPETEPPPAGPSPGAPA